MNSFSGLLTVLIFFVLTYSFQNCAPVQFGTREVASLQNFSSEGLVCDPTKKPLEEESISCPTEMGNQPLVNVIYRTAPVSCVNGEWVRGAWTSPPISSCGCANSEMLADTVTGLCACPMGKILENNQCVTPACNLTTREALTETKACSESGTAFRTRTASCQSSNLTWSYSAWSAWNYSQCTCGVLGASVDANGVCKCPIGQNNINGSCGSCDSRFQTYSATQLKCVNTTCNPDTKPSSGLEQKACSFGTNKATRTCTVTCNTTSMSWSLTSCGAWDYSACTCPAGSGKTIDSSGSCVCPSGQIDNGSGVCTPVSCTGTPQTSTSAACTGTGMSGTAYATRTATCNTTTNPPSYSYGAWNWNYSTCSCSVTGQTATSASACSCPAGQYVIGNACGTCGADYTYNSSTKTCDPRCTQSEVLLATKSYFLSNSSNDTAVATDCIDAANTTLASNLPSTDSQTIRYFNTCGNRYCSKSLAAQGYMEGRIVERNSSGVLLECRKKDPPPTVSDSCRQKLLTLPPPIVAKSISDTGLATACIDSANPTIADNIPEATGRSEEETNKKMIRWIFTCSSRYCASQGFSSGRMVERNAGVSHMNCYNEEIFNSLNAGTIVSRLSRTLDTIATTCIDGPNPLKTDSYPSKSIDQHLRFVNTCGRRYCVNQGFSSGYVTEIAPAPTSGEGGSPVTVLCIK